MTIKTIQVGPIETNCYIISEGNPPTGGAILIDPGDEAEKIIKELGELKLKAIILTHLHFDHIIAARKIKSITGAKIYCCKDDLEILDEKLLTKSEIDGFLEDKSELTCLHAYTLTTIFTPGHTPGSICLYDEKNGILFSGDTIFAGSIGVTHFKGGDFNQIKNSIENKLFTLPDDTLVYPGHGRSFVLGEEKDNIKKLIL